MVTLSQGIKDAIEMFGMEVVLTGRLINVLKDFNALSFKPFRNILREMINLGLTDKFYRMHLENNVDISIFLESSIQKLQDEGFQRKQSHYVVYSLAYGMGLLGQDPGLSEDPDDYTEDPEVVTTKHQVDVGGISFNMIEVVGSRFMMGATAEQGIGSFDEKPAIDVVLDTYYIAETPVTQELWEHVMCTNPSHFKGEQLPVERVSYDDCMTFISKLNQMTGIKFSLPTEAQWEYAARGGNIQQRTKYAGANDDSAGDYIWYKDNSNQSTHPVKSKKPNQLGLYDMSGNVSELCNDWYSNSYTANVSGVNPTGPQKGLHKVIRGGSFNDKLLNCRVAKRATISPQFVNRQVGFRLAANHMI